MQTTYKANRFLDNIEKAEYCGVGFYDFPKFDSYTKQIDDCEFIGFNYAKTCDCPEEKGVHFFIDDYQMERCWRRCDSYTELLKKFKYVCSPDFSLYSDFPIALQIFYHYKKQWLAAYWKERGVNVIPSVNWSTEKSFEFCFDGIPKNCCVAVSSLGAQKAESAKKLFLNGYNEMLRRLEPTQILICGKVPPECKGNIKRIIPFAERRFRNER
jgi:hypothetical protein